MLLNYDEVALCKLTTNYRSDQAIIEYVKD
jgi:hypothetical protein